MANLLLTGLSGLTAFRSVLDTTGNNIVNANTEGYSRQRVELSANNAQEFGSGFVGSGVSATNVSRIYDSFLSTQLRSSSSAASDLDTYYNFASQVDGVLANENIGLSGALQDYFNAVQAVADDPTSIPARQVLLTEGEVLEKRFGTLDTLFTDIGKQVSGSLKDNINDVNSLGESIASINNKIIVALGGSGGRIPNDLLDQRDKLIDDLSKLVNVNTNEQENGAVNVFIGSGQPLVLGITSNTLGIAPSIDPNSIDIVFNQSSSSTIVTRFMTGGEIGGTLRFKSEVLDTAKNTLNEIAVALSVTVNQKHVNGLDLDGQQGLNFFSAPVVTSLITSGAGALAVTVSDPSSIQNSGYTVVSNATNYTITNLTNNTFSTGLLSAGTANFDGLTFDLSGAASSTFTVTSPTKDAAKNFKLALTDPRDIAAALPVVSETANINTGTGGLSNIAITNLDTSNLPLPPSLGTLSLVFDGVQTFTLSAPAAGTIIYDPAVNSGQEYTVNVPNYGNITFTLTGQPNTGDTFSLVDNTGGIGDNRNAHSLAGLQTSLTLSGGTASFQDVYGQVVADVGRRTQAAEINGAAQNGLLAQTVASKDAISGVSLDEEAANLIRFQQAYQAASQVILTSRTIFDTLLGAFR